MIDFGGQDGDFGGQEGDFGGQECAGSNSEQTFELRLGALGLALEPQASIWEGLGGQKCNPKRTQQ